jgi:hypothetical protein
VVKSRLVMVMPRFDGLGHRAGHGVAAPWHGGMATRS